MTPPKDRLRDLRPFGPAPPNVPEDPSRVRRAVLASLEKGLIRGESCKGSMTKDEMDALRKVIFSLRGDGFG